MDRYFRKAGSASRASEPLSADAWLFGLVVTGETVPQPYAAEAAAQAERERLERAAQYYSDAARQLQELRCQESAAQAERKQLEWLAKVSDRHAAELRELLRVEAEYRARQERLKLYHEERNAQGAGWDPEKHPRGGYVQNLGMFSPAGGSAAPGATRSPFDAIVRRARAIADLTGVVTPGMIRSSRLATTLQSAIHPAVSVSDAAAGGLVTGGKAVVNGTATAIKNVATLGLSDSQLELIDITKEDRERGYNTAVLIATTSGEVLIAVGTGGIASALSKGGTIARTASGALIAYDAIGNAIGVVQGVYDASNNGVNLSNGTKIAGGLLGLGANALAVRGIKTASPFPKGFDPAKGFATFEDFKDAFGAAGPGHAWHHIVEQTVNSGKFAAEILHNPANLLKLPHGKGTIHAKISGFYSSRPRFTGGLKVRDWLSKRSFKEQFEFGIQKIKDFGGTQYLPPDLR